LRRAAALAAALSLFAGAACQTASGPPFQPIAGEDAALRARVDATAAEASARQSLRAVGKLKVASPDGTASVKEVVLAARPALLRLESLNLLGQAATLLVTDGEQYSYFDGTRLESGALGPEVLRDRLGLAFAPGEAVRALLAEPLEGERAPAEVLGRGEERMVKLPGQALRYAPSGELAELIALDADGHVRWSAAYADWQSVPGGRYPFSLVLFFPETRLRAELELAQVELNPALDPTLFRVGRGAGK
jgi:hypothetical protein